MNTADENEALKKIGDLLPSGYIKFVPFSVKKPTSFEFDGITVKLSAVYLNEALNCYMVDLSWGATDVIYGIPLRCGVDILNQYHTPLPNLVAYNHVAPGYDVTSWRQLRLFIFDKGVLERGR